MGMRPRDKLLAQVVVALDLDGYGFHIPGFDCRSAIHIT